MKRLSIILLSLTFCNQPLPETPTIPPRQVYVPLSDWEQMIMAMVLTESRGNPLAVGKDGDRGMLQLRPIYVMEANRLAGTDYTHDDAYDIEKSLEMFAIVQGRYNPDSLIDKAIRLHNPGSSGKAYRQNLELVRRMEEVRKAIVRRKCTQ